MIGTEEVSQEGVVGILTIIEQVTTIDGEETNREVLSKEVTTAPVNKVIQVGTKAAMIEDIATKVMTDKETGISVKVAGSDKKLNITASEFINSRSDELSESILDTLKSKNILIKLGTEFAIYDIHLSNEQGEEVSPSETVTVLIPYESNRKPVKLYYFGDNFEVIRELDFIDNGDSIEFDLSNFSYFGVQFAEAEESDSTDGSDDTNKSEDSDTSSDTDLSTGGGVMVDDTDTPVDTDISNSISETVTVETPDLTVESTDEDLPPTGVASTTITSILGALFLSIGSALGFKKWNVNTFLNKYYKV